MSLCDDGLHLTVHTGHDLITSNGDAPRTADSLYYRLIEAAHRGVPSNIGVRRREPNARGPGATEALGRVQGQCPGGGGLWGGETPRS